MRPDKTYKLTEASCSYEFSAKRLSPTDVGFALMWDREPNHHGLRHVVLFDASVHSMDESAFRALPNFQ